MVKVLIKKLDPGVKLPEYKTSGASGVDLIAFIKEPINLEPKTSVLIPTGLSVAFSEAVSYTHLRAHETPEHLVCRLLLEKKNF